MKMNRLESLVMNSALRDCFLRWVEGPLLARLGGRLDGQQVLEIGCGRGTGTRFLLERLGARRVTALDLDPAMVAQARRRLAAFGADRCEIQEGDATRLKALDASFDSVVTFAALHHIPEWRQAVAEIARVLKPGGRFLFEEVTAQWIRRWPYRVLFEHPKQDRFSAREFVAELERQGIEVGDRFVTRKDGDFVFGAGRKRMESACRPQESAGQARPCLSGAAPGAGRA